MDKKKNNEKYSHTVLPEVVVPQIKEPRPVCRICGEPIEAIIEAISESDGSYSHFDCVLGKIRESYNLADNETVSYIGQGCFGICVKDEEGKFTIKEKIPYENVNSFLNFKKFVEESKN